MCGALGVSRGGLYAWLQRPRSRRNRNDEELGAKVRASFIGSDRTYGARRVWRDLLAEGIPCGLRRIERLMRLQALKARPRRRRLPPDLGEQQVATVAANVLDRTFVAPSANRKWIADFTTPWKPARSGEASLMADGSLRFPAPWRADTIPGGYVVRDANGQAFADEARRVAGNIARLPQLLEKADRK
jgi:putative transposase